MAEKIVLEATKRSVTGKQVRQLRNNGVVPATLYGPEFEAVTLQVPEIELRQTLLAAGGAQIIDLKIDGENYNALVRNVQRNVIRGDILHVDFYRVRMDVAIRTEVPIVLRGDMVALEKAGLLVMHEMNSVLVECLPGDLPSEIQVDLTGLMTLGARVLVGDLPTLPGVTYHADASDVVLTIASAERMEAEEVTAEEAAGGPEPELIRRREEEEGEEEV